MSKSNIRGTMKSVEGPLINTVGGISPSTTTVAFALSIDSETGKPKVADNGKILGSSDDGLMYVYMDKEQASSVEFKDVDGSIWFELTPLIAPSKEAMTNAKTVSLDW